MPDGVAFTSPPVREVELSVYFALIPELAASHLSGLREGWRDEYPRVAEEYPDRPWKPSEQTMDATMGLQGRFPCPLVTFSNDDGDAVAVQSDRIVRRWSIGPGGYPGFEKLREDLRSRLSDLTATFVTELDAAPQVVGASCRYINLIEGLDPARLALGLLTGWSADRPTIAGSFVGLHVHQDDELELDGCNLSITVEGSSDGDSLLRLTVDTDSDSETTEELGGLNRAHDVLVRKFLELTTKDQQDEWGRLWL